MKDNLHLLSRIKRLSSNKFTSAAISLLSNTSDEQLIWLTYLAEKIPRKDSYRKKIRWIRESFRQKHPSLDVARRILRESNPIQRKKIVNSLSTNSWRAQIEGRPLNPEPATIRPGQCLSAPP